MILEEDMAMLIHPRWHKQRQKTQGLIP